jgi:AraC-like DNA-binding protein
MALTLRTTGQTIHVRKTSSLIRSSRYSGFVEDIVGDAIRALRIGEARSARAYLYDSWSLRWDPSLGAGFNIHVVLAGGPWLRPEGRDPVQLRVGDIVFISRVIAHAVSDSPTTPLKDVPVDEADFWFGNEPDPDAAPDAPLTVLIGGSYYLKRERMHPLLEALPPVIVLPSRDSGEGPIHLIVDLLGAEHDNESPGTSAAIPALLDLLLAYVIRAVFETVSPTSGWAAAVRDRAMTRALVNMQNRPEISWTIESLARASGLSRATFARRFTDMVAQPPLRYLTWWRMTLAGRLLTESDLPISVVAQRVGYSSEFAFGKAFAREMGIAPGAYRRKYHEKRRSAIARR